MMMLAPVLTPHGLLTLRQSPEALALEPEHGSRLETGVRTGLRDTDCCAWVPTRSGRLCHRCCRTGGNLRARYVTALCALPGIAEGTKPPVPIPADGELDKMAAAVPPMTGAEYLTTAVLADLWRRIDAAFDVELAEAKLTVQEFLKRRHPAWNLVGRVHFNLAENRKDEDAPFAFLATYTTRLSAEAKAQHLPLGKALQEYAGAKEPRTPAVAVDARPARRRALPWLKAMVDAGEIFHPLRWSPAQAVQFLKDVPALESAGVVVRMPASWRMNRPARPQVKATVGGNAPSQLGMDALLDFRMEVTLDGEKLSAAEIKRLLAHSDGLALIRGKWVEVDHERLRRTLEQFEAIERHAADDGLSFGEAMRMLAGAGIAESGSARQADIDWSQTVAGPWLAETLAALRHPDGLARVDPGSPFRARCVPISRRACNGFICSRSSGLERVLPTTWGWARPSRCLSLLLVLKNEAAGKRQAEPARGAGLAARQLGRGDCAVCTEPQSGRRPSIGDAAPRH